MHELVTKVRKRINAVEGRVNTRQKRGKGEGKRERGGGITFELIHGIWRVTSNSVYVRLLRVVFRVSPLPRYRGKNVSVYLIKIVRI
jgi:hypothetical protein